MFVHSWYSLRYGAVSEADWVDWAAEMGMQRFVLADINNTAGIFSAMRLAQKKGVQVIPGIDFRNAHLHCYTLIAQTWQGLAAINGFLTKHLHSGLPFPERPPQWQGVLCIYPFRKDHFFQLRENEYVGIQPKDLNQLAFSPWRYHVHKLIAFPLMSFRNKRDYNAHRLLRAIEHNCLLSKLPREAQSAGHEMRLSPEEVRKTYEQQPQLLAQMERLLDSCCFHYTFGQPQNKRIFHQTAEEDWQLLVQQTEEGLIRRYGSETPELRARLQKEYETIRQKGFVSYFLIAWDVVRYASHKGFFHVGRGSGANSLVAYCMGITDVDPIELDLYFERFINLYRENPPDFDLDFSWRDRDEVHRYMFEKHSWRNTALLATVNTFQYRATLRELGKVFGLPKAEIDRLCEGNLKADKLDELHTLVIKYSHYLHDYPNYLSIHAGGVLVSDKPMDYYTATFVPPKGLPTTQFDMYIAEDIGLYKFDILSQRGLGHIRDAVEIVRQNRGEPIDIHDIPRFKRDPAISTMLQEGRTMGAFYVESPAMRQLLKKMGCTDYISLVAASSIIRPGVARSGMMREYIRRYRFPEARKDAHPIMLDIMPETFGVMVYQEDVIKVAHYYAGLSLAEADVLRRGMSGKFRSRSEFERVKEQFFINCKNKGYPDAEAIEIWRQIESFAGYSFAKGHSASFAVESYQSLFLRAHYPLEFMCAVINNFGGFYSTEMYIHEARMLGAQVEGPCVNESEQLTRIEGKTLWLGLGLVKSLEQSLLEKMLRERQYRGSFEDLEDFHYRMKPGLEQLKILIKAGAFRFTGKSKKELYWQAHLLMSGEKPKAENLSLFREKAVDYTLPSLQSHEMQDAYDELELLGFALRSPFDWVEGMPENPLLAQDLSSMMSKQVAFYGYLVTIKPTKTIKGERMYFGTFVDVQGHWMDTVHFPQIAAQYPFRGKGIYHIRGKVCEEYGVVSIEVGQMERLHNKNLVEA